jgi:hypothetical protein
VSRVPDGFADGAADLAVPVLDVADAEGTGTKLLGTELPGLAGSTSRVLVSGVVAEWPAAVGGSGSRTSAAEATSPEIARNPATIEMTSHRLLMGPPPRSSRAVADCDRGRDRAQSAMVRANLLATALEPVNRR